MDVALRIKDLRKTYDNGFQALKGIDLEVKKGDFFALLGPNGAGKSTTLGIVTSLVNKSEGSVQVFDFDTQTQPTEAKLCMGIVPQEFNFNQFEKVLDIVVTQAGFYGIGRKRALERAEFYLKELGLWEKRNNVSRMLSGGMKRRLMIARALVHDPKLLILDEPTAGVDIELRRSMWEFLRKINAAGTTIILTTHYLEEAESLCRNIAIIDKGEIVQNTSMKALLAQLNMETFVLDLADDLAETPDIGGLTARLTDPHTLEVDVPKAAGLNGVFEHLNRAGVKVLSMRNKANRLEELFVSLVEKQKEGAAK